MAKEENLLRQLPAYPSLSDIDGQLCNPDESLRNPLWAFLIPLTLVDRL